MIDTFEIQPADAAMAPDEMASALISSTACFDNHLQVYSQF